LRAAGQQRLQRLPLRGRLARQVGQDVRRRNLWIVSSSADRKRERSRGLIGLGPPVISPMARRLDISSRLAIAMPIEALVNGTPVLPMTAAPAFRLRSASGMSAVTTISPGPAR